MADDTIKIAIEAVDNATKVLEATGKSLEELDKKGINANKGLISVNDALAGLIKQERAAKVLDEARGALAHLTEAEKDTILQSKALQDALSQKPNLLGFESFQGALVSIQAGIGIAKEAIQGLQQVWDFAKQGAENQQIAASFQRTAKSIGSNADDIIAKLDEAAKGTVDDEELMQASTRALTLGVAKSGDDLVNVMKLARGAALQFGGDAGTAFENINQAIGNLAPRALKQYGIIVSLKDANEAYAKSIGVSVDALTEEQQRQALLNAVLEQGAKNFGDIGNSAATTGEKMKALETRVANLVDVLKETAATGFATAFDITDAPKNALEAFTGTAEKMKAEVVAGKMSVKDYNDALRGMANNLTAVLPGALADSAFNTYKLDAAIIALGKDSNEGTRQLQYTAQAARDLAAQQAAASTAAQKHTEIMRAYSAQLLANVDAYQRTKINLADTTVLAIAYTEAEKNQAEVQKKLDDLNQQIASHGAARSIVVKNEKLSTDDLAKAQLGLAVAQEDLAGAQRKAGETEAEFALRVETLKGKVSDYNVKLGEHTAIVGGATKAELEQKAALEGQIAALQKTDEINRAKGAFEALTAAFRSGALTEGQYQERAAALNQVAGLYTASALTQATAQEILMKSFADPRSETWRGQLLLNEQALDGQIEKTGKLADTTNAAADAISKAGVPTVKDIKVQVTPEINYKALREKKIEAIEVPIKPKIDTAGNTKLAHDLAGDVKFSPTITPKVDTTQAAKDIQAYTTDKVGAIPKEKTTRAIFDSTAATRDTNSILKLFGTIPATKKTEINVDGKLALQTLDDIIRDLGNIFSKSIEVKVKYTQQGEPPPGFAHGGSYIVPPSPTGSSADYFPVLAAQGERVTIETKAQQRQQQPLAGTGDTYNYTTNVYNPLAAAMLADKQRRDRLARSNSRMGVT